MISPVTPPEGALPEPAPRGAVVLSDSRTQMDCKLHISFTSPLYFPIFSATCMVRYSLTTYKGICYLTAMTLSLL